MPPPPLKRSLTAARAYFESIPAPLRGGLWMAVAGVFFSVMTAMIRPAAETLHPFELVFFRNLFGVAFLAPWLFRKRINLLRSPNLKLHWLRATLFLSAMLCWFSAIPNIDLVDAVSLNFMAPIFATVLSARILREVVRVRRWTAILIGFSGTLVILRPGFESISTAAVLVLADAVIWAFALILVRVLARTEPPATIVAHMFAWVTPLSLVPALFVWTMPVGEVWLWILGMTLASTIGHLCATRALAIAETSAIMPFDYLRLLSFGVVGYVAFGEVPDRWTLVGAAIIAASTFYIGRREAKLARGGGGQRNP